MDIAELSAHKQEDPSETGDSVPEMTSLTNHIQTYPSKNKHKEEAGTKKQDDQLGLKHPTAILFLILWYIFSFVTLIMNKYVLSTLRGEPTLFGTITMIMCTIMGGLHQFFPCGMFKLVKREKWPANFYRNILIVGTLRASTVSLGLISLKFVAASFTETVKSSAPLFTVFISKAIIGEKTGVYVFCSLIPIVFGLALCSAYELSFNVQGFVTSLATNLSECFQNVYGKMLRSCNYTPGELQFYTSASSLLVQIPVCLVMMDYKHVQQTSTLNLLLAYVLGGIFYHFQTITEYVLLGFINPVTHSVANTVKRALMIWLSILIFSNPVTFLSGLGTVIVTVGVMLYNKAKQYDEWRADNARVYSTTSSGQARDLRNV